MQKKKHSSAGNIYRRFYLYSIKQAELVNYFWIPTYIDILLEM